MIRKLKSAVIAVIALIAGAFTALAEEALPAGYTQIDYIQSTGSQYINTGYKANKNTRIEAHFNTGSRSGVWSAFFGALKNDDPKTGLQLRYSLTQNKLNGYFFGDDVNTGDMAGKDVTVTLEAGLLKINDSDFKLNTAGGDPCDSELFIFAQNDVHTDGKSDDGGIRRQACKLYWFKIHEGATPVRDYVPCRTPWNEIGLYDRVGKRFYGNCGGGAFVAPPNVPPPSREVPQRRVPANGYELRYSAPANIWDEALPIGSGRLGGMVWGGVGEERIDLNEDTIWTGEPGNNFTPGFGREQCRKAIEAMLAGESAKAEYKLLPGRMTCSSSYQPFGALVVKFPGLGKFGTERYLRRLSLDEAVATTEFTCGGVTYRKETIASLADDVIALRVTADRKGALNFTATFETPWRKGSLSVEGDELVFDAATGGAPLKRGGVLKFQGRLAVVAEGGATKAADGAIAVTGADAATLFVSIGTNFRNFRDVTGDAAARAKAPLGKARARSWDDLRARHVAGYRKWADRCTLDLGPDRTPELDTDKRLAAFRGDPTDGYFVALYFRYGRYLLISGSQPGTQPTNLQGIWNRLTNPPWGANYTVNINTQMNYWPAETTGLGELAEPLWRMCDELAVTGVETASSLYGAKGWTCHHNTDLWRITYATSRPYGTWPSGGTWLAMHLWEHYLFTRDLAWLRRHYATLKGAAEFMATYAVADPKTGRLTLPLSSSPENMPKLVPNPAERSHVTRQATMDHSLMRDIFNAVADAADALGTDAADAKRFRELSAKVEPFHIGSWGQLTEYGANDWDDPNEPNRYMFTSNLYGLYPSAQITFATPDLLEAARVSLEHHGDLATGWGICWRQCLWARLRDGERAFRQICTLFRPTTAQAIDYKGTGGTYPNLLDAHPPFQIDGNFGCTAGIVEMLVQSYERTADGRPLIRLLPALPKAWPAGEVKGICARGGSTVDLRWAEGKPVEVTVRAPKGFRPDVVFADAPCALVQFIER